MSTVQIARLFCLATILAASVGVAAAAQPAPTDVKGTIGDFNGVWETVLPQTGSHYRLTLEVWGANQVKGTFVNEEDPKYSGTLFGDVSGGRLNYNYDEPEAGVRGYGYFVVSAGQTLSGIVHNADRTEYSWEGKRVGGAPNDVKGATSDFAGVWGTQVSQTGARYTLTLVVNGSAVTGKFISYEPFLDIDNPTYSGTLSGTVNGARLDYTFTEPEAHVTGSGYFIVSAGGTISGLIRTDGSKTAYSWEGARQD